MLYQRPVNDDVQKKVVPDAVNLRHNIRPIRISVISVATRRVWPLCTADMMSKDGFGERG